MKKLIALLVAVMMLSTLALSALPVYAAGETDDDASGNVVYLSGEGSDENDGSRENPVATLVKAYELLGAEGGTICLIGDLTIAEEYRALCDLSADSVGPVTLTSENDATLTIAAQGIWFPSDTVIENIQLYCTYTEFNSYLVANCNSLTIGENVTVTKAEEAYGYPIIYGSGFYSFAYIDKFSNSDANITIQSGTWAEVYAGGGANGWGHVDDVPGNATVTVTGGTIGTIYGGGNGSVGGEREVAIEGNVRLDISGGTIEQVIANGKTASAPIKGDVTVRITGGEITEITVLDHDAEAEGVNSAVEGNIILKCDDTYRAIATNFPELSVIYVSATGSDENDGTRESPVATFAKAYELLGAEGGMVCLISDLTIEGEYRALCDLPADSIGPVTLTSEGDVTLTFNGPGIWFATDTLIEDINLCFAGSTAYIVANGHRLVVGANVNVTLGGSATVYPAIYGGGFYSFHYIKNSTGNADVTIQSGTWSEVFAGGATHGEDSAHLDDIPGNATVTVTGGTIGVLYGGGNGGVGGLTVTIEGNVTLNVSGGTIEQVVANGKTANTLTKGDVTLNITGGDIASITVLDYDAETEGVNSNIEGTIVLNCDDAYREIATNFPEEEEPEDPDNPGDSDDPTDTGDPSDTDEPSVPETSDEPTQTEPEGTDAPGTTAGSGDDEGGCASVVGGSLALIAVVSGAAALVIRKKHH